MVANNKSAKLKVRQELGTFIQEIHCIYLTKGNKDKASKLDCLNDKTLILVGIGNILDKLTAKFLLSFPLIRTNKMTNMTLFL